MMDFVHASYLVLVAIPEQDQWLAFCSCVQFSHAKIRESSLQFSNERICEFTRMLCIIVACPDTEEYTLAYCHAINTVYI